MNDQMKITFDGQVKGDHEHKVELAIQRLRTFEPSDGYYVAFSGGKDSQCVYHLCKMAGVKFDAHYAVTSVDPPELIRFIRENYPDVIWTRQYYDDGLPEHYYPDGRPKPKTMWSIIPDHTLPPTRKARYCCALLKETGGQGRVVVTGVRWAESVNRRATHGVAGVQGRPKATKKLADEIGAEYKLNKHGEIIMNDDNDANRRMVEQCYRTQKTMVNPIVDWTDKDVWDFLNENGIEHCSLYDEGQKRLGCIGCPLSGTKEMLADFERYPKYKEAYIRAFQRMIDRHPGQIRILDPDSDTKFKLNVNEKNLGGGVSFGIGSTRAIDESPDVDGSGKIGWGTTVVRPVDSGVPMMEKSGGRTDIQILRQQLPEQMNMHDNSTQSAWMCGNGTNGGRNLNSAWHQWFRHWISGHGQGGYQEIPEDV